MFCERCGARIPENAAECANCRYPVSSFSDEPKGSFGFSSAGDLIGSERPVEKTPPARPTGRPTIAEEVVKKKAPDTVVPGKIAPIKRISAFRELRLLLRQGWLVMLGERRNLIISILFPFIAGIITVWIAGEDMFVNRESTNSACFIIVCAAIWGGLFNSIQSVVKERENIKRDYVSGALRLRCYTASRTILQFFLCLIQSAVLTSSMWFVHIIYENDLPETGLILDEVMVEFYISVFLVMFASDTMGLMISSFVKKDELAGKLAPYILIAQLLFSGVLFAMEGAAKGLSALMISRWGMESLGSISGINELPSRIAEELPMYAPEPEDSFIATAEHLGEVWAIMLLFVIVPLILGNLCLHGVKRDTRS